MGWIFLALSVNLTNDFKDKDRNTGIKGKSLIGLSILLAIFGFIFIYNHSFYWGLLFTVMITIYNFLLKQIPVSKNIYLSIAYCLIPYFAFAVFYNIIFIITLFIGGVGGELAHSVADQDTTYKILKRVQYI